MQFVIWGCGNRGKTIFDLLNKEHVAAYIDQDPALKGCQYEDVPIITYELYLKEYVNCPIIVSPIDYELEILSWISKDGIEQAFPLTNYWYQIFRFYRQLPLDVIMQNYDKNQILYIYGYNLLGLLMYLYFCEHGYACKLILQDGLTDKIKRYVANILNVATEEMDHVKAYHYVLLSMPVEKSDELKFMNREALLEYYYEKGFHKELFYNPKLKKFSNYHKSDRCFIVATGPSLQMGDLDKLHRNQEICFSVNGIFKAFDKTKWRPDYYVVDDPSGTRIWHKEILSLDAKCVFIADWAWGFTKNETTDNMYKWHLELDVKDGEPPQFSSDFASISYCGRTVIYDGVLQLAVYMGFKEIYLLGTDCCNYSDPQKQHFVSDYNGECKTVRLSIDDMILAYQSAKDYADAHGIKIYNATRGGALEVFERVDFDTLFND